MTHFYLGPTFVVRLRRFRSHDGALGAAHAPTVTFSTYTSNNTSSAPPRVRFQRVRELERALKTAQAGFDSKKAAKTSTKKQETQLVADEDGIIELRSRLVMERAEYLAQKEITPDYVEPPSEDTHS